MNHNFTFGIIALMIVGFIVIGINQIGAIKSTVEGTVITNEYKPKTSEWGYDSDGDLVYMTEEEKFLLIVKIPNGQIISAETIAEIAYSSEKGDTVYVDLKHGYLFGDQLGSRVDRVKTNMFNN